jgi:hypothetical protein
VGAARPRLASTGALLLALFLTACAGSPSLAVGAEIVSPWPSPTAIVGEACAPAAASDYALAGTPVGTPCAELAAAGTPLAEAPPAEAPPRPTSTPAVLPSPSPAAATVAPSATATVTLTATPPAAVRLAVIGDYGLSNPAEEDVAVLVRSWRPDAVLTVGDNNYPFGSPETIDLNIGQYYAEFIHPYHGAYGPGAETNRFFPTLGNHDWVDLNAQAYFDYFELPGNERYYEVRFGPVSLFALDSQPDEPDGITVDSTQGRWLEAALAASDAPWKLVTMHHPPYSSGPHQPVRALRWPFAEWGATAVLAGHDHIYERIERDGVLYFVNGLGGAVKYAIGNPVKGSQLRYNDDFGAMLVEASTERITFSFVTRAGEVIDTRTINR